MADDIVIIEPVGSPTSLLDDPAVITVDDEPMDAAEDIFMGKEVAEEFYIPSAKDDLLRTENSAYSVVIPLSLEEVLEAIGDPADLKQRIKDTGMGTLSQEFEAIASTIWHFKTMSPEFFQSMMSALNAGVDLGVDLFSKVQHRSPQTKKTFRSHFKVAFYILCQYIEQLEKQIRHATATASTKKGGQKQRAEAWMNELRMRALESLTALSDPSRPWSAVWQKKKVDGELVRLLFTVLSRFCEDVGIASAKSDVQQETALITKAFSNAILVFDGTEEFLEIMLKLFHRHDACGSIAADIIGKVYDKPGSKVIVDTFSQLEQNMDEIAQDNSIGKAYSNMLNGFTKTVPNAALFCLEDIEELLKSDAFSVRNACIALVSSGLCSYYTEREKSPTAPVSPETKKAVESCWQILLGQSTDANAFVRAKVLHCLTDLAQKNCITKKKYPTIFEKVIARSGFGEKAQTVRKAALQCLMELLELCQDLLENPLDKMQAKFLADGKTLMDLLPEDMSNEFSKPWIIYSIWINAQKSIARTARLFCRNRDIPEEIVDEMNDKSFKSIVDQIQAALEQGDGSKAFFILMIAAERFPEEKIVLDYQLQGFLGEYGTDVPAYRLLSLFDCMREILNKGEKKETKALEAINFILTSLPRSVSKEVRESASEFRMLQDDMALRILLSRSVPNWDKTLQMMIASDITEVASFLIYAERKGFREAVHVLRRLPVFFASETKEIRETALAVYRKFFMGEKPEELLADTDPLVKKLIWELPCTSATNLQTLRLLFKNEDHRSMVQAAKKLIGVAASDDNEHVWRACLALSVLPAAVDKTICDEVDNLYKRCLRKDQYDPRLICTFCDVLIKIGKSPLAKEDVTQKNTRKLAADVVHPMLFKLLDICSLSFSDPDGAAQTQMYGKIVEALFAISDDPHVTMKHLMFFTLTRLKLSFGRMKSKAKSTEVMNPPAEPAAVEPVMQVDGNEETAEAAPPPPPVPSQPPVLQQLDSSVISEMHHVLYFGTSVVFIYANWIENLFSVSHDTKDNEAAQGKNGQTVIDENEPDGPSEDDRGKAAVLQLRTSLIDAPDGNKDYSGVHLIVRLVEQICHGDVDLPRPVDRIVIFMALIRLMLISEIFCQKHIRFLLKVLRDTDSLDLKKILLIGFSDIAVRFVNIVQQFTDHFTQQLHHANPSVRYHALMAVVRLIVNDLVKARGQLCDIAMLICDPDERVSAVSRGFFKEKVTKQGITNMLPQLIAREDFYTRLHQSHVEQLMHYLVELAGKTTTDMEGLVEVFMEILENDRPARQWQIAAYGLTLTGSQLTEKFPTALKERISGCKKSLADDVTAKFVLEMVAALRKKLSEDKKRIADDLTRIIKLITGDTSADAHGNAQPSTSRGTARSTRDAANDGDDSNSEDDEDDDDEYTAFSKKKPTTKSRKAGPQAAASGDDSSPSPSRAKRGRRGGGSGGRSTRKR